MTIVVIALRVKCDKKIIIILFNKSSVGARLLFNIINITV